MNMPKLSVTFIQLKSINNMQLTTNFNLSEFHSKCGTPVPTHLINNCITLALALEVIRSHTNNKPLKINSGFRSKEHNTKVGGKTNSFHLLAKAVDIVSAHTPPKQLFEIICKLMNENKIPHGAVILYKTFVHYDIRGFKLFMK